MEYKVKKQVLKNATKLRKLCENYSNDCVREFALLSSRIRVLFNDLAIKGLNDYPKVDSFYHKITTDSLGTFIAVISVEINTRIPTLLITSWDLRINPYVFPNLYPLVLDKYPIYDKKDDGGFGFNIVIDARGYENYIGKDKKPISTEWFKKVTPFEGSNGFIQGFVRRLNGDECVIYENGTISRIDDNYTKQLASAKLGESQISRIVIEIINQYFKRNLILVN